MNTQAGGWITEETAQNTWTKVNQLRNRSSGFIYILAGEEKWRDTRPVGLGSTRRMLPPSPQYTRIRPTVPQFGQCEKTMDGTSTTATLSYAQNKKGHLELSATLLATPSEARESNSLLGNNLTLFPACQCLHAPYPEPTLNPSLGWNPTSKEAGKKTAQDWAQHLTLLLPSKATYAT